MWGSVERKWKVEEERISRTEVEIQRNGMFLKRQEYKESQKTEQKKWCFKELTKNQREVKRVNGR